jgi:hypothetical protein
MVDIIFVNLKQLLLIQRNERGMEAEAQRMPEYLRSFLPFLEVDLN